MESSLKLGIAVGLLTRPSKHRLTDTNGATQWVTADPLLVQLLIAVGNSTAAPTFKATKDAPLPINAGAHDLLERITAETRDHWWQTYKLHHGHGRNSLTGQILAWTLAARQDPQTLDEAADITTRWVSEIQAMFQPERRWEIRAYCPYCRQSRVLDHRDEDGHAIMRPALAVMFDQNNVIRGAECAGCGYKWGSADVVALARFVAAQGEADDGPGL